MDPGCTFKKSVKSMENGINNGNKSNRINNGNKSSSLAANTEVEEEALWVKSPLPDIPIVKGLTIPEIIREKIEAGAWGHLPALTSYETGISYTHDEVLQNSKGLAAGLIKSGFNRGDVVAIVLPNVPEYPSVLFGIWEAGLVATLVNPLYTHEETKRQLEMSDAVCVITELEHLSSVKKAKESNPKIRCIITVGEISEGCLAFHEMIKSDTVGVEFFKGSSVDTTEELALLPFSSGTVAQPKGVMLTHSNLVTNLFQTDPQRLCLTKPYTPGKDQERFIGILHFFHIFGLQAFVLQGMYLGAHTLCLRKFHPDTLLAAVRQHKPTMLHLVKPLISHIANSDNYGSDEFKALHTVGAGGSTIGPSLINRLLKKTGKNVLFLEGYGMTEASPDTHSPLPENGNRKVGSVGSPVPSTITKIVDINGKAVGRHIRGELCVKGGQVMKGYYKNEEATRKVIDADGWFHTGDIGYYDDDGDLYIVDRIKEMIEVQGIQVSPSELEDVLRKNDKVEDVAVIGIPNGQSGEAPRACIIKKSKTTLTEEEIHAFINPLISKHEQLKGGIEFRDDIPKGPSGKILKMTLIEEYQQKQGIQII